VPAAQAQPVTPPRPTAAPATRDGLFVNLAWEGILLVVTVVLVGVTMASTPAAHLDLIIRPLGYGGLIASGLALSLRTGTPNLAVGSIAAAAGVLGAHLASVDHWSQWVAMLAAVAMSAVFGLMTGLVVAGLSVPAWAATLVATLLLQSVTLGISGSEPVVLHITGTYPTTLWVTIAVVVSLGGAAVWLIPAVRTALSATRSPAEPGRWAGLSAGLGAVVGLTGSSLLAGAGGVALAYYDGFGDPAAGGFNLTLITLAAVLVGGVSVFGRRAGVAGTLLGVVLVQTVLLYLEVHGTSADWIDVPVFGLAVLGLGVSRATESITDALGQRGVTAAPPLS
jgi:ribose/xylose/arabinose/galactoside ABC-type transport system permease subunit